MGVNKTIESFKGFSFGDVNSKDYGVYLTAETVYNAPVRDVETVTVPGRNGDITIDRGRFENISLTFSASIVANSEADFRKAIDDFRNALCSKIGYQRLEDDYNPDEYRLAVYKNGLDVTPGMCRTGEFSIVFNCKPQRFLKSGEVRTILPSGAVRHLTNPTLFDSQPLLEIYGSGAVNFENSGKQFTIDIPFYEEIGDKILLQELTAYADVATGVSSIRDFSTVSFSDSDTLTLSECRFNLRIHPSESGVEITDIALTSSMMPFALVATRLVEDGCELSFRTTAQRFSMMSPLAIYDASLDFDIAYRMPGDTEDRNTEAHIYASLYSTRVDLENAKLTLLLGIEITPDSFNINTSMSYTFGELQVHSTLSALGNPVYIDTEAGQAYKVEDGEVIALDNLIYSDNRYPVLMPGTTDISFNLDEGDDLTLAIIPRWWKL